MMKRVFLIAVFACMAMGAAYAQVNEDERTAYNRAIETGTVEAWQSFLADYPSGHYVEQARKLRDAAIVNRYCNEKVTLESLTSYIDTVRAFEQPDPQLPH